MQRVVNQYRERISHEPGGADLVVGCNAFSQKHARGLDVFRFVHGVSAGLHAGSDGSAGGACTCTGRDLGDILPRGRLGAGECFISDSNRRADDDSDACAVHFDVDDELYAHRDRAWVYPGSVRFAGRSLESDFGGHVAFPDDVHHDAHDQAGE